MHDAATLPVAESSLYDQDLHAWAARQASLLRSGRFGDLDAPNLIEELESLGISQENEVESRLTVILIHLLKWAYQPERRSRSWSATLKVQRRDLEKTLSRNPTLRARFPTFVDDRYWAARVLAGAETGLEEAVFPERRPWMAAQIADLDFWPEA